MMASMFGSRVLVRAGRRAFFQHRAVTLLSRSLNGNAQSIEPTLQQSIRQPIPELVDPEQASLQQRDPAKDQAQREHARRVSDYHVSHHIRHTTAALGATVEEHYRPQDLLNHPPKPDDISLELLLASQTHLGHSTALWNPANSRYIFGVREDIHIISLDITAAHLRRAARVTDGVAERGGIILFVGTRNWQSRVVIRAAELAGGFHVFERWVPGSITNAEQFLKRCELKVVDEFDRQVPGFEDQLVDQAAIKPDLVIVLNPLENFPLLRECALEGIPTIGIIDTDADPSKVTYPIPANDDSLRSVSVIAGVLSNAAKQGRERRLAAAHQGRITYSTSRKLAPPTEWKDSAVNPSETAQTAELLETTAGILDGLGPSGYEKEDRSRRGGDREDKMLTHGELR